MGFIEQVQLKSVTVEYEDDIKSIFKGTLCVISSNL